MWNNLPNDQKEIYKKLILAFSSLSEAFSQKSDDSDKKIVPFINSKYQETAFQKAFNASAEDIDNTSFDCALKIKNMNSIQKYLIGVKTFSLKSKDQKIAQFKSKLNDWSPTINEIQNNSINADGSFKTKEEINTINNDLYHELAIKIAQTRNKRILSSKANIQGFKINKHDEIKAVYHVLMPSNEGTPKISVGETSYTQIDTNNLTILGCTDKSHPLNFKFKDNNHTYKYTSADSQLYMNFENNDIIIENWDVVYPDDVHSLLLNLADKFYGVPDEKPKITESFCWKITNSKNEVERYSGFNLFYGLGSRISKKDRVKKVNDFKKSISEKTNNRTATDISSKVQEYITFSASSKNEKVTKENLRNEIMDKVNQTNNPSLIEETQKMLFRVKKEMYIPIPNSKQFHLNTPDFFGEKIGTFKKDKPNKLAKNKEECSFNLVFEPSGQSIRSFITQDNGKAIESCEKQSILGNWILKGIFQLDDFEPLTTKKLNEVGINGIRLYKTDKDKDVHIEFIWIDDDNLPSDYYK